MANITSTTRICSQLFAEHLEDLKVKAERYPQFAGSYLQSRAELIKIRNKHIDGCTSCLAAEAVAA